MAESEKPKQKYSFEGSTNSLGKYEGKVKATEIETGESFNILVNGDNIVKISDFTTPNFPTFFQDSKYIINRFGEVAMTDSAPIIIKDRMMIPINTLSTELDAKIAWKAEEQKITFDYFGWNVELWIGKDISYVNGKEVKLDVAPQIINGRTMVPLRFIVENFYLDANWDAETKSIMIVPRDVG